MSEIQVGTRYAKSLIDLAVEENALEAVRQDIEVFLQTLRQNSELQAILKNPIISLDKKAAILEEIFGKRLHTLILNFFRIVVRKGRSEVLYGTAREFINQYNILKNVVKATVRSASPLSPENLSRIEAIVREASNGEVQLTTEVDPDLIGGFVLKVGDRQIDTTVAGRLNKLRKEFEQA